MSIRQMWIHLHRARPHVVVMFDRIEGCIESVHGPFDDEATAEAWAWPNGHLWSWAVLPLEAQG